MEWVETTAKSVEAAKDLALDRLGVDEHDAEFEILEEPRPGLFGRVRGEARVRARVRPVQPRPKNDRRERRRSPRSGGGRGGGQRSTSKESAEEGRTDGTAPAESAGAPAGQRRPSRSRGGRRGAKSSEKQTSTAVADGPENGEEPRMTEDVTVEEQGAIVQEFVEGLVDAFGYDAEVGTTRVDDETVEVHVDGDDLGLLVGPKGATLQAIQELSRTVVQRRASGNHEGRVRIDVAGYRERRREALERFTRKMADQVVESGTAQVLEPMAPPDRKVVHDTVNLIDGVRTTSEGDEPRRRVVILPDES